MALALVLSGQSRTHAELPIDFNQDVQPILADRCYACHGPDEHSREADLRLDRQDSALGTNEQGAAIVPGKSDVSELVRRINSGDQGEIMPPSELHKPLTDEQKRILIRWIDEGATYQEHWSLVPPKRVDVPRPRKTDWPRNPIDHFILARAESEDLSPSRTANLATLIRRATLDLTGLPPTPEEVDAFVIDPRKNAYEFLIARLMSTTAYAERRAQDWLDLARYADTRGFADDQTREIWPYRDWVVQAIEQNMRFDEFTILQLAGDMLPEASDEQRLATAFHRNAPQAKGQTYPTEEYRIKGVVDRVNTIGRVWFGLTLDCAQCHDHKFDPISQRDYYSLMAIFNNVEHGGSGFGQGGPTMNYTIAARDESERNAQRTRLESDLTAARNELPPVRSIDSKQVIGSWSAPTVVEDPGKFSITGDLTMTAKIRTTDSVADIVSKYDWRGKQRSYVFGIGGEGDTGSLPGHLYFWVSSKLHPFAGVTVYGSQNVSDGKVHRVAVEFVAGHSVRLFVDGIEDTAARVTGRVPASIAESNRRLAIGAGYQGGNEPDGYQFTGELSEIRISDQAVGDSILHGEAANKVIELQAAISRLDAQKSKKLVANVPIMRERSERRETFVHLRGSFLTPGDRVTPAVPAVFSVSNTFQPRNRLEFARWLVDGKNPLVARVVVNRFWQGYFGRGLVATADDFGAQGKPPSHPKLLDWLAVEFVESGWDMKHIHRLIVTSATYRQSARVPAKSRQQDPENLLLSHMPRVRLPAEQIRDQALAISGLLVNKVGGPPVFPAHPQDYWQQRALPGKWTDSQGGDRHRKSMYTYWRRMALHPSLELLNAPARENCVVRRAISNVPTQALVLMNDPIFHEAATVFASRLLREVKNDDAKRLERAFRLALARSPDNTERDRFLEFIGNKTSPSSTAKLSDHAAWSLACGVLLNLDETVTRP